LAAVLGGAQSLHTNAKDEAIALPSEASALTALRTQQIIAWESGAAAVVDPLGGSYYIEKLTDQIESQVNEYLEKIEKMGGAIKAIESGYLQKEIQDQAYQSHLEIEAGTRVVVGVNRFVDNEKLTIELMRVDPQIEEEQKRSLSEVKKARDQVKVEEALKTLAAAAQSDENLMPYICEAVDQYATVGEISGTLGTAFGKFQPASTL
jgi:methylmalonyl-CoA mutase N-terminal domain/subunit